MRSWPRRLVVSALLENVAQSFNIEQERYQLLILLDDCGRNLTIIISNFLEKHEEIIANLDAGLHQVRHEANVLDSGPLVLGQFFQVE